MLAKERAHWRPALLLSPDRFQPFLLSCLVPGLSSGPSGTYSLEGHRALTVVDVIPEIAKSKSSFHLFRG
jgi:hypothetical protein